MLGVWVRWRVGYLAATFVLRRTTAQYNIVNGFAWGLILRAHSEQAVIAHVCHGHTLQLSAGLSVYDSMLVVSSNPVRG